MSILNADELRFLQSRLDGYKQLPKTAPFGFPIALVTDLLETLNYHKTLKKRYQRLAINRHEALTSISTIASKQLDFES